MFGNDRDALRKMYCESWRKLKNQHTLTPLEQHITTVIKRHPEYHKLLETPEVSLQADYIADMGESNPFLHMGMHLGLQEQIATDRPEGIQSIYQTLVLKQGEHNAEHAMIECLGEAIWLAQRNQSPPNEVNYLACLKKL